MTSRFRSRVLTAGRAIGLYAAGGLATSVVGFLALPVFTRLFNPEEFGVIGLFTAAVGLLAPVMSLGGFVFILYDTSEPEERAGVPGAILVIATAGAAIALGAGLAAVAVTELPMVLAVLAVGTAWGNVWILVRLHAYQRASQPGRYFVLSAVPPVAAFVATVLFAIAIDGWEPRIYALAVVAGLGALWSAQSLQRSGAVDWSRATARLREVASFGAPLIVHTASIWVVGFTDRFFVAELEGLEAAGVYTVAYAIGLGISAAHDGVSRYFVSRLPNWVADSPGRARASRFCYGYTLAALLSIPLAIPLAILGLDLLAADSYSGGAELLLWLVPAQTLAGVARVFTGYLYIERRTRQRAGLSAAEAVLNVILTWFLVSALGVIGAAVATFITYAASVIGTYLLARRGGTLLSPSASRRT